jgi:hypothetical protein
VDGRASAIARLVVAHEDTVRDVIHRFNEIGSVRKLADFLADNPVRRLIVGPERLRQLPDQCLLDQPQRGPVRTAAQLHHGRLEPAIPTAEAAGDDACRATVVGQVDRLPGGVLGRLAAPVLTRVVRRGFKADLARLRTILESDVGSPG